MNTINQQLEESPESMIVISQKEYGELRAGLGFWKYQHQYAIERLGEAKEEIAKLEAKVRDLNQRLFGKKTEKGGKKRDHVTESTKSDRSRGQQKGKQGHGRTLPKNLPVEEVIVDVADPCCPVCGEAGDEMATTDDCDVIEIKVKPYIRRIRRKKLHFKCDCEGRSGFIVAPPSNRLVPKGKLKNISLGNNYTGQVSLL